MSQTPETPSGNVLSPRDPKSVRQVRFLADLAAALQDETPYVGKLNRAIRLTKWSGFILLFLARVLAAGFRSPFITLLVCLGMLSGLLIGMFLHFRSSLAQWPILRRLLDVKVVQRALETEPPQS